MNTALSAPENTAVAIRGDEIQVTASTSSEMEQSQTALIAWSERKIALVSAEALEMQEAADHAKKRKWKWETLQRHATLAAKRVEFYRKLKAALEHGYIIVPSFPVEVFAIRSPKNAPKRFAVVNTSKWPQTHQEHALAVPAGEGEYRNPFRTEDVWKTGDKDERGNEYHEHITPDAWSDLDFPLNMAKPQIMEATDRAMALKIFDDFGVLPGVRRNQDPMIIARVLDPRSPKYAPRFVSFIIKWHLDTSTL